jgi:hypothetical protein
LDLHRRIAKTAANPTFLVALDALNTHVDGAAVGRSLSERFDSMELSELAIDANDRKFAPESGSSVTNSGSSLLRNLVRSR